jgi:hypothetical protein
MTTIQDTLTYADGSLVNGQVVVSTPGFQSGGVPVAGTVQSYDIVNGNLTIALYSNANAQPLGVYYTAKYELENGALYDEYWIVPNLPTVNLGQCRVSFPPTPSVLISATQLMSTGAQPGMILMWDGAHWVPAYLSMTNVTPNTIGLTVTANPGANLSVTGSPAALGSAFALNVPDAGTAARGVVTTGAQTFAGVKNFQANVGIGKPNPAFSLDVVGDINITGQYRENGVPIGAGGSGGGPQTPWASNIDAAGFSLLNAGGVGVGKIPAYAVDAIGDVNVTGAFRVNGVAIPTTQMAQTPWVSNIDGGNFTLTHVSAIGIGIATALAYPLHIHVATDSNIIFAASGASSVLSVCKDDISTPSPMTYYANPHSFQNGPVGIGTTAPSGLLHVNATTGNLVTYFTSPSGSGAYMELGVAGQTVELSSLANGDFALGHFGVAGFIISSIRAGAVPNTLCLNGGKVGIGAAAPGTLLVVTGAPNNSLGHIQISSTGNNAGLSFYTTSGGAARNWQIQTNYQALGNLDIMGGAATGAAPTTPFFSIDLNGNVGIGRQPTDRLTVQGFSQPPSASLYQGIAFLLGTATVGLEIGGYGASPWPMWLQSKSINSGIFPLTLNPLGGSVGVSVANPVGAFQVSASPGSNQSLVVLGAQTVSGAVALNAMNDAGTGNIPLEIRATSTSFTVGNVGIGLSTAPAYPLQVTGVIFASAGFLTAVKGSRFGAPGGSAAAMPATDANVLLYQNDANNWSGIGADAGGNMWFRTGLSGAPNPRVLILASGFVGINANPAYQLDVVGDVNCSGAFRVNGVAVGSSGVTTMANPGRALNTAYQNTTGKPLYISVVCSVTAGANIIALVGPSSANQQVALIQGGAGYYQEFFIVLTGWFYQVQCGGTLYSWTEWN